MDEYSYRNTNINYGIRKNSAIDVFKHVGRGGIMEHVRTQRASFNHVAPSSLNYDNQEIYVGVIDHGVGKSSGYKFEYDNKDRLQNHNIKAGIAVSSYINVIDSPSYTHLFGTIMVDDDGDITVSRISNNHGIGPILVNEGNPVITDEVVSNSIDDQGRKLFQCRLPKYLEKDREVFDDGLTNYYRMRHHQIQHVNIITTRTALVFTPERIMFVYVPSDDSSPGMDLSQLTQLCLSLNATFAVSLDYGSDAKFCWREASDEFINIPYEQYKPINHGNIMLSYIIELSPIL